MSCGVGRRHGLDPTFLWLWCRPAATAPSAPAWEPPYAVGAALKSKKKKKEKEKVGFRLFGGGEGGTGNEQLGLRVLPLSSAPARTRNTVTNEPWAGGVKSYKVHSSG